ncbi:peroxisomal biogenesis factor 3 [Culicoides brevitarsis]|uniref:peroxisomal biogenesis factor 3 n=1 Tax=Culicoides brevitarsis TaxID=469753 RepID=UPI00307C2AF3
MFSMLRNFISRHKRKFVITALIFSVGVTSLHYARRKLIEFQEKQAKEFIEKNRRIQHFESTERTCNQAVYNLYPNVVEVIAKLYDTNNILQELREKTLELSTNQKIELWDQLLIKSFTRLVTLIYSSTILVIHLRIQLNILAGFIFKEIDKSEKTISQEIQNRYLSLIQHFIKDGIRELALIIRNNTEGILKKYNFKQKLDLSELEQLFWSIQMAVNQALDNSNNNSLVKILLPSECDVADSVLIKNLLTETIDMLETDEIFNILTNHLGLGFSTATDEIAKFFSTTTSNNKDVTESSNKEFVNVTQVKIPLAKLVPIIDGLAPKTLVDSPFSINLINMLINSDKIKMLGANTYEVFCN